MALELLGFFEVPLLTPISHPSPHSVLVRRVVVMHLQL